MDMPSGTYYIGDLCYVFQDRWDEFCNLTIKDNECLDGVFTMEDGTKFATFGTMHGDGTYRDNLNHEYSVDAGLIGCVLVENINFNDKSNSVNLGHTRTFHFSFEVGEEDGTIKFGSIQIFTGYEEDEEDESEY